MSPDDVLWLCVGRGSRDAAATAEMDRFVTARLALTPVGRADVAFLAMAEPHMEEVVSKSPRWSSRPWSCNRTCCIPARCSPGSSGSWPGKIASPLRQQWILAECLGCDRAVARVVVERYREATSACG